jgi:hypothetical protein
LPNFTLIAANLELITLKADSVHVVIDIKNYLITDGLLEISSKILGIMVEVFQAISICSNI